MSKGSRSTALLLVVLLTPGIFLLCSSDLVGQTVLGTIKGTVKDSTGAIVPGVTVVVKNLGTAKERQGLSNESGDYVIADLEPAEYEVSAERTGHSIRQTGVRFRGKES